MPAAPLAKAGIVIFKFKVTKEVHKLDVSIDLYTQASAVAIQVTDDKLLELCASLGLLEKQLIDSLVLIDGRKKNKMTLHRSSGDCTASGDFNSIQLYVSKVSLDYWIVWLLRYYRDSVSDVNHIDTEFRYAGTPDRTVDLALKVDRALPSVPIDEARRRLGL